MSSRAMRKLMDVTEPSENIEIEEQPQLTKPFNPFDLLGESDSGDSSEENSSSEEDIEITERPEELEEKKELEELLKEFNMDEVSSPVPSKTCKPLFTFHQRHFNPLTELGSIFGRQVLKTIKAKEQPKKLRTLFIQPNISWPSLSPSEAKDVTFVQRSDYYQIKVHRDYQRQQIEFQDCVATLDPNAIAFFLSKYPYHLDGLLQMSQVFRHQGDVEKASELIEKALFRIDCALPVHCGILEGEFRLDYTDAIGKSVFLVFFRYMQNLARKGCPRTALEYAKLLLTMSPQSDPLCVLFWLDFLSLRANQLEFLQRLCSTFQFDPLKFQVPNDLLVSEQVFSCLSGNLLLMPNFSYSMALSVFLSEPRESSFEDLQFLLDVSSASASDLMKMAIIVFPEVIEPLLIKSDPRRMKGKGWAALNHSFFKDARISLKEDTVMRKLVDLYVERVHPLWKSDAIFDWVQKVLCDAVAVVDGDMDEFRTLRQVRGILWDPRGNGRYTSLNVDEFRDVVTVLPEENLNDLLNRQQIPQREGTPLQLNRQTDAFSAFLMSLLPWVYIDEQH